MCSFLRAHLERAGLGDGLVAVLHGNSGSRSAVEADFSENWEGWAELVLALRGMESMRDDEFIECASVSISETLRRFLRLAEGDVSVRMDFPSDMERLVELEREGWERRDGQVWGRSDCLADSLLQLLVAHDILPEEINENGGCDRDLACAANRDHLWWHENRDLRPKNYAGVEDYETYLEHDRHADEIVSFFMEWFEGVKKREIPH